jgi:Holliday junction resolvasome RuvABC endonuclease subunit
MDEIYFIGFDPSLNGFGYCVLNNSDDSKASLLEFGIFDQKKNKDNHSAKLKTIYDGVSSLIDKYVAKLSTTNSWIIVATEGCSFSMPFRATALGEVSGMSKLAVYEKLGREIIQLQPNSIKKFITGGGKADKNIMLLKVHLNYGHIFDSEHLADAFGVAELAKQSWRVKNKQTDISSFTKLKQDVLKKTVDFF